MSDEALLDFSRAAADALRSALPLGDFLRGRGLVEAADAVAAGGPLHAALGPGFPPLFIAMVRAGEESGKLDAFLDRYSASLETRIDFRRRLSRVLAYPLFAVALAAGLFLLFSAKAAPMLLLPLSQAGVDLPPGALRFLDFGDWLRENWAILLGGLAGAFVILRELAASRPGRKARSVAGRILPGLRYVTEEARVCEFEATLGLLLGAGLRPREAFEVLLQIAEEDPLLRRSLARGAALLPSGASFGECVAPSLPAEDRPRFLTAEKAGRLDETLGKLAESHRERHLHRLKSAALAIQLASVVALAPMVFGLVMGLVWPALSSLRTVAEQAASLKVPKDEFATPVKIEIAPKAGKMDVDTARFNVSQAAKVVDYMQENAAPDEPKKVPKIKIKDRSIQRLQKSKVRSTEIRSNLE